MDAEGYHTVTHMVEVDIHTLELEVGSTVVPNKISETSSNCNHLGSTYSPSPERPCSEEIVCLGKS